MNEYDRLNLVATSTAASCVRIFMEVTSHKWGRSIISERNRQLVDELVRNAVAATGNPVALISVCLLLEETSIIVEVWDRSPEPPDLRSFAGYDLNHTTYKLGGGKVVSVELPTLPWRRKKPPLVPVPRSLVDPLAPEPGLLRRVRDGLMGP